MNKHFWLYVRRLALWLGALLARAYMRRFETVVLCQDKNVKYNAFQ